MNIDTVRAGSKLVARYSGWLLIGLGVMWLAGTVLDRFGLNQADTVSHPLDRSKLLKGQPTAKVQIKAPVTVYQGRSKELLQLPPQVQVDAHEQVLTANTVPADLRPQTVTTTINTDTGAVQTFVKTDPYPWLAYEPRGEARLMYGYRYDNRMGAKQVTRLAVHQDLLRIKALTAGVGAHIDSDGSAFVGVGVAYKW